MKSRKKTVILVFLAGAVVVLGIACFLLLQMLPSRNSLELENNATVGIMPGIDREQRLKELQNELDKGLIAFSINTSPLFDPKTQEGNLMLENPKNNAKLLVAQVVLNENAVHLKGDTTGFLSGTDQAGAASCRGGL